MKPCVYQKKSQTKLLFKGYCSHISLRIFNLAIVKNIVLIKFPSHLTDKLQPLDKCVFGPFKTEWNKLLIKFGKEMVGKGIGRLTKGTFSEILGTLWSTSMKHENIVSGFVSTGLFPYNKTQFPDSEFDPVDLEKYYKNVHDDNSEENLPSNSEHYLQKNSIVNSNIELSRNDLPSTSFQISSNKISPSDIVSIFSNQLLQ